jgi:hypothetical protein
VEFWSLEYFSVYPNEAHAFVHHFSLYVCRVDMVLHTRAGITHSDSLALLWVNISAPPDTKKPTDGTGTETWTPATCGCNDAIHNVFSRVQ